MHQIKSVGRCSIAAALAAALLIWPAAGFAQLPLPLPLPSPSPTTSSTVVGDASAAQVSLLGILGTATTTALADTGPIGSNDALDASMVTGCVPSTPTAETLTSTSLRSPAERYPAASR